MNTLNLYVPEKAAQLINQLNYKNKDQLFYFCDMIYSMNSFHKKDYNGWTDIPQNYLSSVIKDKKTLSLVKNILLDEGIIECDNYYSKVNKKALGYKYNDQVISKLIKIEVSDKTIFNNIIGNINNNKTTKSSKLRKYKNHFLKTFKLDTKSIYTEIDNWYDNEHYKLIFSGKVDLMNSKTKNINNINYISNTNVVETYSNINNHKGSRMTPRDPFIELLDKYNQLIRPIKMIEEGRLYFNRNKTNNRIDSNLTTLKSEYKKYIISPDKLISIDITNSQPYLLSLLLTNNNDGTIDSNELKLFCDYTKQGMIYEMYQTYLYKKTNILHNRKDIKDILFKILFSKEKHYIKYKTHFNKLFPTIMEYINKQTKKDHSKFAVSLQKLESSIIIDDICDKLNNIGVNYYTIHDSIICSDERHLEVLDIMKDSFNNRFNSIPKFKVEKVNFQEENDKKDEVLFEFLNDI